LLISARAEYLLEQESRAIADKPMQASHGLPTRFLIRI